MKFIQKLIFSIIITSATYLWIWFCQWTMGSSVDFPYSDNNMWWINDNMNLDISSILKNSIDVDWQNWFKRLLNLFMPDNTIYNWGNWPSILFYIKTIVNFLLWFISLIALILLIYAFYMIFFKKDEAGITSAKQTIKWVAIALVVIWLSRIIVSFLFRFENENTQNLGYKRNNIEIVTSLA